VAQRAPSRRSVHVRVATLADAERIAELRLALIAHHQSNPVYSRIRRNARVRAIALTEEQLASDQQIMFVAVKGERVVGMLRCIEQRGHRLLWPARYAHIGTVYVQPSVRRRGVLRSLMHAAIAWSRERGLKEMRLQNAIDNPIAMAAWEALGFRVVEQVRLRRL
jgi:ribosomal protein S18 acetylase RimI-like enzyme